MEHSLKSQLREQSSINARFFWERIDKGHRIDINPRLIRLIKHGFSAQDATFAVILGKRGSGKTDLALLLSEMLSNDGLIKNVSTNTKIINSPFEITHINNLVDLEYWGSKRRGKKIFIFDEIADAMSRRRPMASLTVELIKKFNKLRKHKLSVIATTISASVLDKSALAEDLLDIYIRKEWFPKNHPLIYKIAHYRNFLTGEDLDLENIPPTSVSFDSWDSSPFTEKPTFEKSAFEDKDLEIVYKWAKGATYKDLEMHPQQLTRKKKKIIKFLIENYYHASRKQA